MAPSLLKSLKPVAGRALQIALNRALALDPDTRHALASLDGRHIDLTLEAPSLAMRISVDGDQLRVGPVDAQEADLAVRSSLAGVLAQLPLLVNARRGESNSKGRVRVAGDAELARRLQQLAKGFDPDWQQPFVSVFGEVLGCRLPTPCAVPCSMRARGNRPGPQRRRIHHRGVARCSAARRAGCLPR